MAKLLNLQEWAAEVYDSAIPFYSASMDAGGAGIPRRSCTERNIRFSLTLSTWIRARRICALNRNTKLPSGGTLLERLTHGEKASTLRR